MVARVRTYNAATCGLPAGACGCSSPAVQLLQLVLLVLLVLQTCSGCSIRDGSNDLHSSKSDSASFHPAGAGLRRLLHATTRRPPQAAKPQAAVPPPSVASADDAFDLVVVGAGMAGLAAARAAQAAGLRVVILEARDRIGGRIQSVSVPTPSGPITMDLGAGEQAGRQLYL